MIIRKVGHIVFLGKSRYLFLVYVAQSTKRKMLGCFYCFDMLKTYNACADDNDLLYIFHTLKLFYPRIDILTNKFIVVQIRVHSVYAVYLFSLTG